MSGILALGREAYGLYLGDNAPRTLFERSVIIAFIVSAAVAWGQERYAVVQLKRRLKGIPHIVLDPHGLFTKIRQYYVKVTTRAGDVVPALADYQCAVIRVLNDPVVSGPDAIAKGVSAVITFYDVSGKELFTCPGRWADPNQPYSPDDPQFRPDLTTLEIPIGGMKELDIVLKYIAEDVCYGITTENYGLPGLRNFRTQLKGTDFSARVRVRGAFIDKVWLVKFRSLGAMTELQPISCEEINEH